MHLAEPWNPGDLCEGIREDSSAHALAMERKSLGQKGRVGPSPEKWDIGASPRETINVKHKSHYFIIEESLSLIQQLPFLLNTQINP